jgi:hypothetical protein
MAEPGHVNPSTGDYAFVALDVGGTRGSTFLVRMEDVVLGEFEVVIMIEVVIEEMDGSD